MARTITEIFNEMLVEKEATSGLSSLTSNSKVSVWRLIFYVCAVAISTVENLFDLLVDQVNVAAEEAISGTLGWYAAETLDYQHGDTLIYDRDTGNYEYAEINEELQIVDLSAATDDSSGAVYVKAAKVNTSTGDAEPLSTLELAGLTGYWDLKKFAGTNLTVLSNEPDKLQLEYRINYDPTILDENGYLLIDDTRKPVEEAIYEFLRTMNVDNFAGILRLASLTDAIQAAAGVVNAVCVTAIAVQYDDTGEVDILADEDQSYTTAAGYMVINPAYPLENYITYTAV